MAVQCSAVRCNAATPSVQRLPTPTPAVSPANPLDPIPLLPSQLALQVPDGPPGAPPKQQVWIVQEYCSRGSLLEAVDRGLLLLPEGPNLPAILVCAQEIAGARAGWACACS